jgi:hypothetical protein
MKEQNAKILSARITTEDHGCLSIWLMLEFDGSGQGFGGYALDDKPKKKTADSEREPHANCGLFIRRVMDVVGVGNWDQLEGQIIRVRKEDPWNSPIHAIGNAVKDKWFVPSEELKSRHDHR